MRRCDRSTAGAHRLGGAAGACAKVALMKHPVAATLVFCVISPCVTSAVCAAENMRAVVVSDGQFQIQSVPKPDPHADQVRIRVHAAAVNPVDWKQAAHAAPGTRLIPGRMSRV